MSHINNLRHTWRSTDTYECHVTNWKRALYDQVATHVSKSYVTYKRCMTHKNEYWHTCIPHHIWMSHVTCKWAMTRTSNVTHYSVVNASYHTQRRVTARRWTSHVTQWRHTCIVFDALEFDIGILKREPVAKQLRQHLCSCMCVCECVCVNNTWHDLW